MNHWFLPGVLVDATHQTIHARAMLLLTVAWLLQYPLHELLAYLFAIAGTPELTVVIDTFEQRVQLPRDRAVWMFDANDAQRHRNNPE